MDRRSGLRRPRPSKPRTPAPAVEVVNFGCRLNAVEGDAVHALASKALAARANGAGDAPVVVVNSCAVTQEAVRQARQTVRRLRRDNPDARLVVTGCAAQIDPDMFAAMPEVDAVLGNADKLQAESWARLSAGARPSEAPASATDADAVQVSDIMAVRETASHLLDGFTPPQENRARAFLQVQNGCDHRCTFCIIPYGRGDSRSTPAGLVVEEARRLVDAGHQELVLTGVDITSWGQDLPGAPRLGALVRRILRAVPELPRLRLSSLDAVEIDPELYEFVAHEPRVAPHLHLSLQAGDDMILKRMKRRHARADAIALCARLRAARPDIAFGADLIAGFPTETEAMFANSLALIEDCGLAYVHVFPFSARPGTPAARMPQLDRALVKDRAARLRTAAADALVRHLDGHRGRADRVLIERRDAEGRHRGRLADFSEVVLDAGAARPGAMVRARFTGHDGRVLQGEVAP